MHGQQCQFYQIKCSQKRDLSKCRFIDVTDEFLIKRIQYHDASVRDTEDRKRRQRILTAGPQRPPRAESKKSLFVTVRLSSGRSLCDLAVTINSLMPYTCRHCSSHHIVGKQSGSIDRRMCGRDELLLVRGTRLGDRTNPYNRWRTDVLKHQHGKQEARPCRCLNPPGHPSVSSLC